MANQEQKVATDVATQTARVITVVSTVGKPKVKINYDGNDWAGLKKLLEKGGVDTDGGKFNSYSLSNMKCVESTKKGTLEHPQAIIPDGDFNLFLMPMKSKSGGSLTRAEAYAKIKGFIAENEDKAKEHFNQEKNYTVKTTDALNELIEKYQPGTKKSVAKEKATAIADVVSSVKDAKEAGDTEGVVAQLSGLSTDEKLDLVIQLLLGIKGDKGELAPEVVKETVKEPTAEEIEQERLKKQQEEEDENKRKEEEEKRKKEEEEDKELQQQMKDLAGGFSDVK